jgi:hypothetical protein
MYHLVNHGGAACGTDATPRRRHIIFSSRTYQNISKHILLTMGPFLIITLLLRKKPTTLFIRIIIIKIILRDDILNNIIIFALILY